MTRVNPQPKAAASVVMMARENVTVPASAHSFHKIPMSLAVGLASNSALMLRDYTGQDTRPRMRRFAVVLMDWSPP